ncbi:uncharacterized protein LOC115886315 [Sitophilus oryzae]|uniref:Uncharacterized protein LOC115886315 n=1 Tax=Sitophilus oryzae TaxID=7048 RepID=A0A6J2YEG0_SITOR|nr:uncharacterized protein LOC115886315 [Sitophilus oryzae]
MGNKRKYSVSTSENSSSSDSIDSEDSTERKICNIRRKIRDLQEKHRSKKRQRRSSSADGRFSPEPTSSAGRRHAGRSRPSSRRGKGSTSFRRIIIDTESDAENDSEAPPVEVNIDPTILNLLCRENETEDFADPIQKDVALQWESILKSGMKDEEKMKVMEKYKVPKNCLSCSSPKLNPEVLAAINETAIKRDERLVKVQSQMGKSLAALGKALSMLISLEPQEGDQMIPIIEALSDGARLLADIHHEQSISRQNVVSFGLDKHLKEIVGTAVDTWLFGENLGERIKNVKQIEKSGQELLKPKVLPLKKKTSDPKNSRAPPRRSSVLAGSQSFKRKFHNSHRAQYQRREQSYNRKQPERPRYRY